MVNDYMQVMLLGHSDSYLKDKAMQVTIAFNHFGEGLIQRMPRCRHGYFHVVNNDYTHWEMYAIGGSAEPTINSQGNRYLAPTNPFAKEVTKRVETAQTTWKGWNYNATELQRHGHGLGWHQRQRKRSAGNRRRARRDDPTSLVSRRHALRVGVSVHRRHIRPDHAVPDRGPPAEAQGHGRHHRQDDPVGAEEPGDQPDSAPRRLLSRYDPERGLSGQL